MFRRRQYSNPARSSGEHAPLRRGCGGGGGGQWGSSTATVLVAVAGALIAYAGHLQS